MYAGRSIESVRCVTTAAALVALVHNEDKAEKLIASVLTIKQFKLLEKEIKDEFLKGNILAIFFYKDRILEQFFLFNYIILKNSLF